MDLVIQIDLASDRPGTRYACGIVLIDAYTARTIHEAGYVIDDADSVLAADFDALNRAMELVLPMSPESVEIRCVSQSLVEHLTGGAMPSEPNVMQRYQRAMEQLLQLDSWQVTRVEREAKARSVELAKNALEGQGDVVALEPDAAERQQSRAYTGVPQWTVELLESPGIDCPAGCEAKRKYPFGPDVPAGFCVHAAKIVLNDGPLSWHDPEQDSMTTLCPHCDVSLRIERVGE